jgi:CIC family chloride channel protein
VLALFLRLRTRTLHVLRFSDNHVMLLWAALAGVAGALVTAAFREGIGLVQWLLVGHAGSLVEIARSLPWWGRLGLPALGGLAAGAVLALGARYAGQADIAGYMEVIARGGSKVALRQSLVRSGASLLTIASGGSIGREGSMAQLSALAASLLARLTHLAPERARLLVACGAAAGITAAYNAPIAGVFFITEIVIGSVAVDSLGPLVVASVVSNVAMRELPGYRPVYDIPPFPAVAGGELILFVLLGVVCGLLAPQFLHLFEVARTAFRRLRLPLPLQLAAGGLAVGAISIPVPEVWGNGYSVVTDIVQHTWPLQALLLVLVCKIAATALTVGSGAVGGIFTPTLFVGAVVGELAGQVAHAVWPGPVAAASAYAIVGMGAMLAAATSAPLMAILMMFEMTLSYSVMLPLMLACVVAYFVGRASSEQSMYGVTVKRRLDAAERSRLRATRMRDLVQPAQTVLADDAPLSELTRVFFQHPVKYIYVVNAAGVFLGVAPLQAVTSLLLERRDTTATRAADLVRREFPTLMPDMTLAEALEHFVGFQGERLPVIAPGSRQLLGVVYKTSLLDAYSRLTADPATGPLRV